MCACVCPCKASTLINNSLLTYAHLRKNQFYVKKKEEKRKKEGKKKEKFYFLNTSFDHRFLVKI